MALTIEQIVDGAKCYQQCIPAGYEVAALLYLQNQILAGGGGGGGISSVTGTANEVDVTAGANPVVSLPAIIDIGGKTSFELPNSAAPSTTVFGQIAGDNNAWGAGRGAIQAFDGTANTYLVGTLVSDAPSAGQVPTWNANGTITWETPASGITGADTRVLFFDGANNPAGDAGMTYNKTTDALTLTDGATGFFTTIQNGTIRLSQGGGAMIRGIGGDDGLAVRLPDDSDFGKMLVIAGNSGNEAVNVGQISDATFSPNFDTVTCNKITASTTDPDLNVINKLTYSQIKARFLWSGLMKCHGEDLTQCFPLEVADKHLTVSYFGKEDKFYDAMGTLLFDATKTEPDYSLIKKEHEARQAKLPKEKRQSFDEALEAK